MRKWLVILAVLAFALVGAPAAQAAKKSSVTIALTGEPPTMDPNVTSNFIGSMVWRWSYDYMLSAQAGTGKKVPWLAVKWEKISPTAVKFWLRKGVKFTDGTPFTAEAIKYSIGRIQDPELKSRQRPYFKEVDRIEILDDHTLIWHNKKPNNGLYNLLARWGAIISPKTKGLDRATISRNTFGSGPYILKSWTKGQKMVFEANPDWWGNKDYPKRPQTVVLRRIRESATRVKALMTGEVDIISAVMPQYVPQLVKNPQTRVVSIPSVRIMYLSFFSAFGGPFADMRVRKAVNYAINDAAIRKTILGGRALPHGSMLHPWNYSGYNPKDKWYGYDLKKAKALMKEAGYQKGFKADLIATSGRYPGDKAICEAIAGMVKKIGIDTPCNAQNFPLYRKSFRAYKSGKKKDRPAMYFMAFGNGAGDAGLVLRGTSACKGAWSGTCMKGIDDAIDQAIATGDPKKQQAEFESVTHMMKGNATHKIVARIHDVYAFRNNLKFRPRHDETLFPWLISVK